MWLHRRSEEPSPTEVACYWAKSKLSKVGSSIKFLTLRDLGAEEELSSDEEDLLFLQEVVKKGIENTSNSQLLKYFVLNGINEHLGLYQLLLKFVERPGGTSDCTEFLNFCSQQMTVDLCSEAAIKTTEQSASSLWFDLRFGRITASKIYDAAHCKKSDGSFVNQILGVTKVPVTEALRGRKLEEVLKGAEQKLNVKFKRVGLQLKPRYPIFGASPDALTDDYVVEINCPQSEKNICNYLTKNKEITANKVTDVFF
ncbi:uncharacterized protein LOC115885010 [Sitophilus oryzae]|uniref:Uncharacterized protein LOC115885010 n=1 Tax=Sitophilus oryzae TaxID=7048 RepID=A0A6J2Y7N3_SITOR|nr:uncharacterized protein LOC115885010 [Sitophilus oryzae]